MIEKVDEEYLAHLGKMQRATPGQSLTNDPNNPLPFEGPPEFVNKKDAIEEIFMNFTEERTYVKLIETLSNGTPVMELVQVVLYVGFTEGKWNPDLFLMLIEPTAYIIMALAERAGVDYRVDREPDDEELEEQELSKVEQGLDKVQAKLSKGSVPEGVFTPEMQEKIDELEVPVAKEEVPAEPLPETEEEGLVARRG